MDTSKVRWAIIARVSADRLDEAAAAAWRRLFGEPPPWRRERSDSGHSLLRGGEPGLGGMLDQWALAIHRELRVRVVALDTSVEQAAGHVAEEGAVHALHESRARELARKHGLIETAERPRTREVLVMSSGTVQALLEVLGVAELPASLRTREVAAGLAAWSVLDGGGVGVFADELSLAGPCYWLMWGPPPREFSCVIVRDGEDAGCFEIPGPGPTRIPALDDVHGQTSPEEICRALGLDDFVAANPMS